MIKKKAFLIILTYLNTSGGIKHVLQCEVTAIIQVLSAEVLDELQVVQTVDQRHRLLHTDICMGQERNTHPANQVPEIMCVCLIGTGKDLIS